MPRKWAIIGPPGTGKTTTGARNAKKAATKHGSRKVLCCSLTKAAARELGGRDTGLDRSQVGTLHSHCYHALDRPPIVESKHIKEWNAAHPGIQLGSFDKDDPIESNKGGDQILQQVDVLRARRTPFELWPGRCKSFFRVWEDFKQELEVHDFSDLIEMALEMLPRAPGDPKVILADEAQDHSALELELLDQWGQYADDLVLIGDPDQSLYHWRGASEKALETETRPRVLSQSYRVPRAVHKRACRILTPQGLYAPKPEEGSVYGVGLTYRDGAAIERLVSEQLEGDGTIMVIASCAYMLNPVVQALRAQGVPYHNPYSPKRWNPLGAKKGVSTVDRLLAWVEPLQKGRLWTLKELRLWIPMLATGACLMRGAKTLVSKPISEEMDMPTLLNRCLRADRAGWVMDGEVGDLLPHCTVQFQSRLKYPLAVYQRFGVDGLRREPQVVVGTIHSVKGGEAHTVLAFPDLSALGYEEFRKPGWRGRGSINRMFYVAATRAEQRLLIGRRGSPYAGVL